MTLITVPVSLIDAIGGSSAFVEAVQSVLVPGAMAFPGALNLTLFKDATGPKACIIPLPAAVLDWLEVADRDEDAMPELRFEIEIPAEFLRVKNLQLAA